MAPNPAELLSEDAFSKLIAWARNEYDTIIIDTPPLGSVIDGAIIAQRCDGAILLVESGALSYRLVQKAKRQLERTGCRDPRRGAEPRGHGWQRLLSQILW